MINNYTKTMSCPVTARRAYKAITEEMSNWWTPMSGRFVNVGDEAKTGFGGDSYWVFKAITLNEPQFIELECVKSHMIMDSLDDPEEWLGTRIRFEISEHLGRSEIIFTHLGLHSQLQCFDVCSGGWDHYILDSLSAYLHDEGGKPNSY